MTVITLAAAATPRIGILNLIKATIGAWMTAQSTRKNLHRLNSRELTDIGLTQNDIPGVMRDTYKSTYRHLTGL
ncbi:DUF1127 domain-containing protein [Paracoccus litorisediminis]|uniref:DUF1127 domain-containing protein n=1 Tax=Paracoccus litorisediminis TaxID=2006130 RepID=UPI003732113E